MSDHTPRVPDFRWDQHHGLFRIRGVHVAQVLDHNAVPFGEGDGVEWEQLPADAVKLEDVEALKREILAVLDEEKSLPTWARDADLAFALLDRIRSIVERKTR